MSAEEEGPYREDARPPEAPLPWSITALASLPLAVLGWGSAWSFVVADAPPLAFVAAFLLLSSLLAGIFGLSETNVVPDAEDDARPPSARYRGRKLAKAGLVALAAPIVLGCLLFGLLLLTCGGH